MSPGEDINPNVITCTHLEGVEPEPLINAEEDRLLKVEKDRATRKAASVKEDVSPCIELQDSGVSHLAIQEDARSLTLLSLPSSPLPTTLEAASMQRSLAINTETPAILVPEHGTDLEPQPHDTLPLPNEGAEPPIC